MIYVINPKNIPNTNRSIIAEPIDVLEIFSIIIEKFPAKFIDLDIDDNLPKINNNDILIFIYDYILPLHREDTLLGMNEILISNKCAKSILISKQCFEKYKIFLDMGFDYLIYSSPEYTILKLLTAIKNNYFNDLENVFFKENNKIIKTPLKMEKIEYIIPKRDINLSKYNNIRTVITSFGCNNNCKFCPTPYYQGKWQSRTVESIIDEIKYLNKLGYNKIMFLDDNFTTSKTRIDRLCNSIKQHKIKSSFGFLSSINNYNYNLFKKMYASGFKWVHFGIESGSNKILKSMNKKQSYSQIIKVLKEVKKIGFKLRISLIIDYPKTSDEDILKTFSLIEKIKPNEIRLHYTAYRSLTPLFNEYKIENKQYIHNNKISKEQECIKNKYIDFLKQHNYDIIDDDNYNWNNNNNEFIASFVPVKYGRNWA